jgi:hypothetical protein
MSSLFLSRSSVPPRRLGTNQWRSEATDATAIATATITADRAFLLIKRRHPFRRPCLVRLGRTRMPRRAHISLSRWTFSEFRRSAWPWNRPVTRLGPLYKRRALVTGGIVMFFFRPVQNITA